MSPVRPWGHPACVEAVALNDHHRSPKACPRATGSRSDAHQTGRSPYGGFKSAAYHAVAEHDAVGSKLVGDLIQRRQRRAAYPDRTGSSASSFVSVSASSEAGSESATIPQPA